MQSSELHEWRKFRGLADAMPDAAERGRLLAAHEMATNPEARKRVEEAYGVAVAMQQYPEAYRNIGRSGIGRFLDRVRSAIPW